MRLLTEAGNGWQSVAIEHADGSMTIVVETAEYTAITTIEEVKRLRRFAGMRRRIANLAELRRGAMEPSEVRE